MTKHLEARLLETLELRLNKFRTKEDADNICEICEWYLLSQEVLSFFHTLLYKTNFECLNINMKSSLLCHSKIMFSNFYQPVNSILYLVHWFQQHERGPTNEIFYLDCCATLNIGDNNFQLDSLHSVVTGIHFHW